MAVLGAAERATFAQFVVQRITPVVEMVALEDPLHPPRVPCLGLVGVWVIGTTGPAALSSHESLVPNDSSQVC